MIFELSVWTVAKFLIKLTKKFGKDWMTKKFALDDKTSELLYKSIDSPEKFGDLLSYLYSEKKEVENIQEKISLPQSETEKSYDNMLLPNTKLELFYELVEEIFYLSKLRGEPIVLQGFLNGELFVSYYFADDDESLCKEGSYFSISYSSSLFIKRVANIKEGEEFVKSCRQKIKYAKYKEYAIEKDKTFVSVNEIHNEFIESNGNSNFLCMPKDSNSFISELLYIKDFKGLKIMKQSLNQYIAEVVREIHELKSISKS